MAVQHEVFLYYLSRFDVLAVAEWLELGSTVVHQHRHFLLPGLFYDMYYLGERVYEWELGPDRRRVPNDVSYYMLSTRLIRLKQDIAAARRGLAAIDHLAAFVPALMSYLCGPNFWSSSLLLLCLILSLRRRSWTEAMAVPLFRWISSLLFCSQLLPLCALFTDVSYSYSSSSNTGMLETHLVSPYQMSPPSCTHVSIDDYNEVCQLYEAAYLKLAVARLLDEHVSVSTK
ncbi:hypothetical protein JCGZ_07839 [Jatropha curcas]|uniref:Uncharacterized protein n=1 Tax=Jatropha curcas TaxID=180498 RepID=A0A067L0M0_JATCU|nr:hypothetical protein JCGZ_07839 [Jatropha curcas]